MQGRKDKGTQENSSHQQVTKRILEQILPIPQQETTQLASQMQTSILENYEKIDCRCVVFSIITTLLKQWLQKINTEQQKVRYNGYYMIGKLYFIFFFLNLFFVEGGKNCPGTCFVDETLSQIQRDSPALATECWDKKNVPLPPSICFISYIIYNKTQNQTYHYSVQCPVSTVE